MCLNQIMGLREARTLILVYVIVVRLACFVFFLYIFSVRFLQKIEDINLTPSQTFLSTPEPLKTIFIDINITPMNGLTKNK